MHLARLYSSRLQALLVTLFLLFHFPASAQSDPDPDTTAPTAETSEEAFSRGMAALKAGEYQAAADIWYKLAAQGDANAQFGLGTLYYDGLGMPLSHEEANFWFLRAAEQGLAPAQYNLGNSYKYGTGTQRNDTMAVHWWSKAAEQGFAPAQFNFASALYSGSGIDQNLLQARDWYQKAADAGHPRAAEMLSKLAEGVQATADLGHEVGCSRWLSNQNPEHFTIQLLATIKQSTIRDFIHKNQPQGTYAVCGYSSGGRDWFALLYGSYDKRTVAKEALAELPASLTVASPYLRRFKQFPEVRDVPH